MFKWCSALSTCSLYQCSATHEQTVHVNKMLTNLSTHCTCSYKNSWHGSKVQCSGTTFQQLACDSWQLLSLFYHTTLKKLEKDATFMLFLSTAVCWPGFCFIVTRGNPLQLSGPWSDKAWFSSSREPTRCANKPKEPSNCSQFLISQWREHRLMLLRSSSRRNVRSSRRPVDLHTHEKAKQNNKLWTS